MAFKNEAEYCKKLLGFDFLQKQDQTKYWFDFLEKEPLDEPLVKLKQDIYNQIINSTNI